MSIWDALAQTLVGSLSSGAKATIRDRSAPASQATKVDVTVMPDEEGEDLGLEAGALKVQIAGAALKDLEMDGAKLVAFRGSQYTFTPRPGIGIQTSGNAPIVVGTLSPGGR